MLQPHTVVNQLYQQTPGHHLQVCHRSHQNSESSKICITLSLLPYFCTCTIIHRHSHHNCGQLWKLKTIRHIHKCLFFAFAHHHYHHHNFVCSCTRCTTPVTRAPTRPWRLVLRATRTTSTTSLTSSCKLLKTIMLHRAKC